MTVFVANFGFEGFRSIYLSVRFFTLLVYSLEFCILDLGVELK